ncbi:MAG: OmpA family protein [Bacteroidota bacterium]|nr:OmpA family protein [Bacteroidota bacterium]
MKTNFDSDKRKIFSSYNNLRNAIVLNFLIFAILPGALRAQGEQKLCPALWYGISGAVNFNNYFGSVQKLNSDFTSPTVFHNGSGTAPYLSLRLEYRPTKMWGGLFNLGFDDKFGKFKYDWTPEAKLKTTIGYLTIEPNLRFTPFNSLNLYLFAGPAMYINIIKKFSYTPYGMGQNNADWSDIRSVLLAGQIGAGYDFPISSTDSKIQLELSPFISYNTNFGTEPRTIESWTFTTFRAGLALKIACNCIKPQKMAVLPVTPQAIAPTKEPEVAFSVQGPNIVHMKRNIKETLPLQNYVFFDEGSTDIPDRYVKLSRNEALGFNDQQIIDPPYPFDSTGRSARQLAAYHNVLNIIGTRMRKYPSTTITLIGSSAGKGTLIGKALAESIKNYLMTSFDIDGQRITTQGRNMPIIPSEQARAKMDKDLTKVEDRRVDIVSNSPELLMQVAGDSATVMNPVKIITMQQDPMDSRINFNANGAREALSSWTLEVTDDKGNMKTYGPYNQDQTNIPGSTILGNQTEGDYKVTLVGQTKMGNTVRKESTIHLVRMDEPIENGLRFSILFEFDKSKTTATYEKFLTDIVTPLITNNSKVVIHGHTDIVGDEDYNLNLSKERAQEAQRILQNALANTGRNEVKFETYGYGEDVNAAPFDNKLPEERFYNRTVIIDVIPENK